MPEQLITLITPIITAGIGVGGAKWVVNRWQTRKDISEIRKEVLHNYTISFKNHVNLMDNFLAELVMSYAEFGGSSKVQKLSSLLPWGYTYKDLEYYSDKIDFDNLKDWKGQPITKERIKNTFEKLKEPTECYIDFIEPPLKKFELQYLELQNKFYRGRPAVMEFRALVNQYYRNPQLLDNFTGMWEYMMACFVLINKVMSTEKEQDFIDVINIYNDYSYYLFYLVRWFEEKLLKGTIYIR